MTVPPLFPLWRLEVTHEGPPPKGATLGRASLARIMHGFDERELIELIDETWTPPRCWFMLRVDSTTRAALAIVADAIFEEIPGVVTSWELVP